MFKFAKGLLLVLVLVSQQVFAEAYQAGRDYEVLPQAVPTKDKTKIEVVELFWYGCGHCFSFEPMIIAWKANQANDVNFMQMPAMWNKTMKLHAKAFYTAKALGVLDKLHQPIFNAMNVDKKRLRNESEIAELFAKHGIDKNTFSGTFNSFGVNSQVSVAEAMARKYRLQGTPEMVVNGKYRVSTSLTGSQQKMLKVVDFLVNKERAAQGK